MELVRGVFAHTVDKVVGSSYDTVRYVAENLEYIKHVSAHLEEIYRVSQSVEGIDVILEHIELLEALYAEIDAVLAVAEVTDEIAAIGANMPALMAIHAELAKLVTIYDNLNHLILIAENSEAIIAVGENIDAVLELSDSLVELKAIYTNMASLLSMISHFGTRAEMVTYVSTHPANVKGRVYTADGYTYVCLPGSTAILDLPGIIPMGRVTPYHFGGKGDGIVDDARAINSAILFVYNRSKSGEVDLSIGRWLVDSANLEVKSGVQLVGSWNNVGEVLNAEYTSMTSMIVLNPLYTVHLAEDFAGIKGMFILKKGIHRPTSVRDMLDMVKGFSGTAITVGNSTSGQANDSYVGYCLVIGFMYAYYSDLNERPIVEYLRGDNTNGIYIGRCFDMNHVAHCHMWGYLAAHLNLGTWQWNVTNAVNNGNGLIRLTTSPNHILVTGDIVVVSGVGGTVEANSGGWVVTVVDATTVDLQGSHFTNAFVTSTTLGKLSAHYSVRQGAAFHFYQVDWGQIESSFCWGYKVGFQIENQGMGTFINCGTDASSSLDDTTTIGFWIRHVLNLKLIGCKSTSTGYGVLVAADNNVRRSVVVTNHTFVANRVAAFYLESGYCALTNSMWDSQGPKAYGILVHKDSDGLYATGNIVRGIAGNLIISVPEPAFRKSTVMWNNWAESSAMGSHESLVNSQSTHYLVNFNDNTAGPIWRYQKSKGTYVAPTAAKYQDNAMVEYFDFWDGVDRFRTAGHYRLMARSDISDTSVGGIHLWGVTNNGSTQDVEVMALHSGALYPLVPTLSLGGPTARWNLYSNSIDTLSIKSPSVVASVLYADNPTNNPELYLKAHGPVPTANIWWFRDGHARWIWNMTNAAEKVPGAPPNSGSDLSLGRYADDSHTSLGSALFIARATGNISSVGTYRTSVSRSLVNGGETGIGYMLSATPNFGVFGGIGAPTLAAAKGSLYLRSDGNANNNRAYINLTGGGTWTALLTVA